MKNSSIIIILIIQVLLIVSSLLPLFSDFSLGSSSLIGAQISLLVLCFATSVGTIYRSVNSTTSHIAGLIEGLEGKMDNMHHAEAIDEEEFYKRFEDKIKAAKNIIYTAHLAHDPPTRSLRNAKHYYQEIWKILQGKENAEIKRVEVYSHEKKDWINSIIDDMRGVSGFNLWVVDGSKYPVGVSPYVSVQVVDDFVYLVAISKHHDRSGCRDIEMSGKEFRALWASYYNEKLVRAADQIVRDGAVDYKVYRDYFS